MILILLTFYDSILLFRILLRANEKEFRVHMHIRSVFECSHLSVSTRCSIYRLGICTGWHSVLISLLPRQRDRKLYPPRYPRDLI